MKDWLESNFDVDFVTNSNNEKVQTVSWIVAEGRKQSTSVDFFIYIFGKNAPKGKEDMLNRCPTDGWKDIVERWSEQGILN